MRHTALGRLLPPALFPEDDEAHVNSPAEPPGAESAARRQLRWRYWRMLLFFARAFASFFFYDVLCDRPGLRFLRPEPIARWRGHARRYRLLAVTWGGVWIKLGQYLSTRVDILPLSVVRELRGLQDEVPAAPFGEIRLAIEREFRRPLEQTFASFLETPIGAASFAQVHEARLPGGQPVVVKVLRPGIEEMVEVDLQALSRALSWLRLWPAVTRRVDLAWIEQEFAHTTRRELDLRAEADHLRRFAANFAADPGIHIPEVYREFSTRRALTEENVAFIKITDLGRLNKMLWNDAAAIWREFGQLLQETPIQVQVDLMFTGRALELLSGIATELDAEFNPWSEAIPFAQMLAAEGATDAKMQVLEGLRQLSLLAKLPSELSRLAGMAQRGRLTIRSSMAPDLRRQMLRLEKQAERLNISLLAAASLVSGAILYASQPQAGIGLMVFAGLLVVATRIAGR